MSGAGRWASSHAGAVVAALVALALVAAGSVARCTAVHAPEEAELTPEEAADGELTDDLRALRKGYTDVTREAIGMLAANVWVDGQGTTVVTLTDRALRVRTQGSDEWEAYAVTASRRETETSDGGASQVTAMCVATPEWTEIATLTVPRAGGALPTLSCPGVCGGAELTLSPALKEVEVEGPGEAILSARGTDAGTVRSALAGWCALWRPTATEATWDGILEEDHGERTCSLYYTLDDQRGSAVTVVVGMDDGQVSVEEGGRQ